VAYWTEMIKEFLIYTSNKIQRFSEFVFLIPDTLLKSIWNDHFNPILITKLQNIGLDL